MKSVVSTILDIYHRLLPDTHLLSHEKLCLEAWKSALSNEATVILDAQLSAAYFVQRQAMGAKVCFYYPDGKDVPSFEERTPDIHAATVTLKSSGGSETQRMPAKIFVHRGRFFSIEFPKRPERYWEQHSMQDQPLEVDNVEIHRQLSRGKNARHEK